MASPMAAVPKAHLRQAMRRRMNRLTHEDINAQSASIAQRVTAEKAFSESTCVALYLAMPQGEVRIDELVSTAMAHNKRVVLPRVVGPRSEDLLFIPVKSMNEVSSFVPSKWGIREPPIPASWKSENKPVQPSVAAIGLGCNKSEKIGTEEKTDDGNNVALPQLADIDLVICPGVAADASCNRIGRGKGYYGWWDSYVWD
eukprot:Selendium_serpulae@DN5849_c1_g2_i2.p3